MVALLQERTGSTMDLFFMSRGREVIDRKNRNNRVINKVREAEELELCSLTDENNLNLFVELESKTLDMSAEMVTVYCYLIFLHSVLSRFGLNQHAGFLS